MQWIDGISYDDFITFCCSTVGVRWLGLVHVVSFPLCPASAKIIESHESHPRWILTRNMSSQRFIEQALSLHHVICVFIYIYKFGFFSCGGLLLGRISISMIPGSSTQSISFISIDVFLFFGSNILDGQFLFPSAWHQKQLHRSFQKNWKIHPIIQSLSFCCPALP